MSRVAAIYQAKIEKEYKQERVVQLAAFKIYHQRKIEEIDRALEELLKKEIDSIEY